jgi:hypothetical protein
LREHGQLPLPGASPTQIVAAAQPVMIR